MSAGRWLPSSVEDEAPDMRDAVWTAALDRFVREGDYYVRNAAGWTAQADVGVVVVHFQDRPGVRVDLSALRGAVNDGAVRRLVMAAVA